MDRAQNQPPPLTGYNVYSSDRALCAAISGWSELQEIGALAGSEQVQTWARLANEFSPVLHTHDRFGNRIDEVEYHPAYHELMRIAVEHGLHGAAWSSSAERAHTLRAAEFYVWSQAEAGHGCPISMTYAAVPAIVQNFVLSDFVTELLTSRIYEPMPAPLAEKRGALCGMAMTEKQGGSDVRANITRAVFAESTPLGDAFTLSGHKWFCSAPMSDAFLMLAQAHDGLTCFFVPRVQPDGSRNTIRIQRLKDKLGNRANASTEIELDGTWALRVGDAGRGIQTIVEMVNYTRLDCINGSAALMRAATAQAIHHASYRMAFGKLLADQPLMQNVLADLAIESEAAMLLLFRLTRAVDENDAAIKRLGTAAGKYYVCKRAPAVAGEALECLGGNGYVEDSGVPRLFRESPLNSIWEGSGNINALDVLRILSKQPELLETYRAEIEPVREFDPLAGGIPPESEARTFAERLTLVWQAALLAKAASPAAELFIDSRLRGNWGRTMGTLRRSSEHKSIVDRANPAQNVEYTSKHEASPH